MKSKSDNLKNQFSLFSVAIRNVHNLTFTLNSLIINKLTKSVNVNVTFFKTFPTRALSPISIIIYIYFYSIINVHMFTRHAKPACLLTYKV